MDIAALCGWVQRWWHSKGVMPGSYIIMMAKATHTHRVCVLGALYLFSLLLFLLLRWHHNGRSKFYGLNQGNKAVGRTHIRITTSTSHSQRACISG